MTKSKCVVGKDEVRITAASGQFPGLQWKLLLGDMSGSECTSAGGKAESNAIGVAYTFKRLNDVADGLLELFFFLKLQFKDICSYQPLRSCCIAECNRSQTPPKK